MSQDLKDRINDAIALHTNAKHNEAEIVYKEILELDSNNTNVLNLLGVLKFQTNHFDESIELIKKAIDLNPQSYFYLCLGKAYFAKMDYKNAVYAYSKSLEISSDNFDAMFNLAMALKLDERVDDSIKAYEAAALLNPNSFEVYFNLGNIYNSVKDVPYKAIECFEKVLSLKPDEPEVRYFLGTTNLKVKNYKQGWKDYETRPSREMAILTQTLELKDKILQRPVYNGEDLKDKTLFVYYEGGLGETTMFARFLPELASRAKKVYFRPQYCYYELFKENPLGCEVLKYSNGIDFDYHIPIMSIPYAMGFSSDSDIAINDAFLKANPQRCDYFKEKYFANNKFKIGIKWQGNTAYGLNRIIDFNSFFKLFEVGGTQFYSLQKEDAQEKLEAAKAYNLVDLSPEFTDFSQTAALIENLDLVICNDTSVAHLACSLGKPCWILLPYISDWRWHTDMSECTWYKSAKLFKQIEPDNWDEVFDRVKADLEKIKNIGAKF